MKKIDFLGRKWLVTYVSSNWKLKIPYKKVFLKCVSFNQIYAFWSRIVFDPTDPNQATTPTPILCMVGNVLYLYDYNWF